ncbi:MAG: methylated-DNA--[protein]-cysteine S-methyltransferase [Bacteroidota bacterium]|nr:MAG: methylated-DNA--[protein]-cysteine S-methyltransferase [Bacteroidota bacterium]
MQYIITSNYQSPFGELVLGDYDGSLCLCDWRFRKQRSLIDQRILTLLSSAFLPGETSLILGVKSQLDEYFNSQRKVFDIPILLAGTDFQKLVWKELLNVGYGTTETYQGLAARLSKQDAIRAIGSANGANALAILVPCHRIVGQNGKLIGYAGGLQAKKKLLELEGVYFSNGQKSLFE